MNTLWWKSLLAIIPAVGLAVSASAQASYDMRSPDERIELRIRTAQGIRYDVILNGKAILQDSSLSMDIDHKVMGREVKVTGSKERHNDQMLEPVVRQKFAEIRDNYNEIRLDIQGGYSVVFRAYNEGVAYRFETSLPAEQVKIYGEEANFRFTANSMVFYPQEDSFFSHNERKYLPQHLSEINPMFLASLPAVVDVGGGAKVAIAESDVEEYPGLWLQAPEEMASPQLFPHIRSKNNSLVIAISRSSKVPITSPSRAGKRTFPWRVLGITDRDADLLTNPLVWLLEKPSAVADTSWIKPGKVAWDWWNDNNIYGVDFKAGINTQTYKYYIDFAAKYGTPVHHPGRRLVQARKRAGSGPGNKYGRVDGLCQAEKRRRHLVGGLEDAGRSTHSGAGSIPEMGHQGNQSRFHAAQRSIADQLLSQGQPRNGQAPNARGFSRRPETCSHDTYLAQLDQHGRRPRYGVEQVERGGRAGA